MQGKFPLGALVVQLGCHTDDLSKKTNPGRAPVVVERHVVGTHLRCVPKHGGLVYFYINDSDVTDNAGVLQVVVVGGRDAAIVARGSAVLADWPQAIEKIDAPWGEFQGKHIILALPTERMREVKDPTRLMEFWDNIYLSYCELDGRPPARERTRYVPDLDISVGFMHAGNPIMYKMSSIPQLINMERNDFPSWGFLHELGHNFQRAAYGFAGTGEVTCNVFTLYAFHTIGREDVLAAKRAQGLLAKERYVEGGLDFYGEWRFQPFLALHMYTELIDKFGWDAFKKVFRSYWNLPAEKQPRSDNEKRDTFVVIMSKSAGYDLAPFFRGWGIPFSEEAARAVEGLPKWHGPEGQQTQARMEEQAEKRKLAAEEARRRIVRLENKAGLDPDGWQTEYRINYTWAERPASESMHVGSGQVAFHASGGPCLRATHPLQIDGDFVLVISGVFYDNPGGHPYYRDARDIGLSPRGQTAGAIKVEIPFEGSSETRGRPFTVKVMRLAGEVTAEVDGVPRMPEFYRCTPGIEGNVCITIGAGDRLVVQRFDLYTEP
jgi:hypothetical protein